MADDGLLIHNLVPPITAKAGFERAFYLLDNAQILKKVVTKDKKVSGVVSAILVGLISLVMWKLALATSYVSGVASEGVLLAMNLGLFLSTRSRSIVPERSG